MQQQVEEDVQEIEEEEGIDERELHKTSEYEQYQRGGSPATYFELKEKPRRDDKKAVPGLVYDLPQSTTAGFKKNESVSFYNLPQPLIARHTQVQQKNIPPTGVILADDNEYIYEEITPLLRSRPGSGDSSEFTPEQLSLLYDLLRRMNEGDIYGMTTQPSSPLPQPPQKDLPFYDDTVSRPAKAQAKQYPWYENEEVVESGKIEDIYKKINDDSEPEPIPAKPPLPPKPTLVKRKPKQKAKVVKVVPPTTKEMQPSINEEKRRTISKIICIHTKIFDHHPLK